MWKPREKTRKETERFPLSAYRSKCGTVNNLVSSPALMVSMSVQVRVRWLLQVHFVGAMRGLTPFHLRLFRRLLTRNKRRRHPSILFIIPFSLHCVPGSEGSTHSMCAQKDERQQRVNSKVLFQTPNNNHCFRPMKIRER